MFTLPNFCRVCLKYDKNLIDLAHIENEPNETLMSKLELCVSEVEWTAFKPLLCHPCIKRLNIAYSFKKQCVQSAGVLKNYVELVKESQKKNESQNVTKQENSPGAPSGTYMLFPNHKYVKILVGSQNQSTPTSTNSYQNVFVNLIPTTAIGQVSSSIPDGNLQEKNAKDTNQNIFLNINNTFQKFIPISSLDPPPLKKNEPQKKSLLKPTNSSLDLLLTDSNAEEMSVEIDPTSFLSLEQEDSSSSEDESKNDWDEVITKQKIDSKPKLNGSNTANGQEVTSSTNFVPILPKDDLYSGGHFLSSSASNQSDINCESCQKTFPTVRLLKQHLKQFHLGKLPFKCTYCYMEYLTRMDYETCLARHKSNQEAHSTSLTLKDFAGNSSFENDSLSISLIADTPADQNLEANENGDYVCGVCKRIFNSSAGLLRHRVRKHNQKNRKKYFIKGMKNAKCDICKRDFSTQSYMQLHRKLHMREDGGYKYKVQGRSKYQQMGNNEEKKGEDSEKVDCTPDVVASDSDSDDGEEVKAKKLRLRSGEDSNSDSQDKKEQLDSESSERDSDSEGDKL